MRTAVNLDALHGEFLPLSRSPPGQKDIHTHTETETLNRWEILRKSYLECFTFPVTDQWTSIDTSAYTLHAKNAPTQIATSVQLDGNHSYDTRGCGYGHLNVTCWWCNRCISHFQLRVLNVFIIIIIKLNKSLIALQRSWLMKVLKSVDTFLTETQVGTNGEDQWAHLVKETLRIRHKGLVEACHSSNLFFPLGQTLSVVQPMLSLSLCKRIRIEIPLCFMSPPVLLVRWSCLLLSPQRLVLSGPVFVASEEQLSACHASLTALLSVRQFVIYRWLRFSWAEPIPCVSSHVKTSHTTI